MHDLFYFKCTTSLVCFLSGKNMHDTELLWAGWRSCNCVTKTHNKTLLFVYG
jgi:hypothetical protein